MSKKRLSMVMVLTVLLISGCSLAAPPNADPPISAKPEGTAIPSSSSSDGGTAEPTLPNATAPALLDLPFDQIQGHIKNVQYADGNQVFISADHLYLYNLDTGLVTAETSREALDQERFKVIPDGYVAVGSIGSRSSSGGMMASDSKINYSAIFYDRQLKQSKVFQFNTLLQKNESILSWKAIAVSSSGTKAAYATTHGLYVYDFTTNQKHTMIDLSGEDVKLRSGLVLLEQLAFTNGDKTLAFKGQSFDIPPVIGKPSFDTCGTVNVDRSALSNRTFDTYTCKELTAYDKLLLLAEDFTIPSGRVLVMDVPSGKTKLHPLTEKGESGSISGSDSGSYFATALDDKKEWIIRIYDTVTGKLAAEQRVSSDGEARYMANDPIIRVIDGTRTYLVLLGANQPEMESKIVAGRF